MHQYFWTVLYQWRGPKNVGAIFCRTPGYCRVEFVDYRLSSLRQMLRPCVCVAWDGLVTDAERIDVN